MSRLRVVTALFALLVFMGCVKNEVPENRVFSLDDLANKKVGVLIGTTGEIYAADYGTDSTRLQLEKFETLAQAVDALLNGSIDAVLTDDTPAKVFARKNPSLRILNEIFKEESYAGIVAKENMGLLDSVNIALIQMRAMGVYDSIFDAYIGGQSKYHVKTDSVSGPVLRVATNAEFPPFEFRCKKRGIVGIDIEIARYVANYLERPVEIIDMDFDDIIDSIRAGKADLGLAAFSVTEERGQVINFTDNYATSKIVVMVRSGEDESTFQRIKDSLFGG
ncbi:polar amino acid transport system substrate-binding protein [Fibrobacter sp. UWB15]|jgi:polar amino acid transport system substrate-binding protein|nr:polar amino acid transport system substrate-binding protein [Fibrobacter sp. UWB6]SHF69459.1 polar amino acid transport system substrate-binding protein [Fibrobacter sp. UWB8]SMG11564.1 polar amino acid transport system substrate-binding protein [Fibrobacter sp. UWB15]